MSLEATGDDTSAGVAPEGPSVHVWVGWRAGACVALTVVALVMPSAAAADAATGSAGPDARSAPVASPVPPPSHATGGKTGHVHGDAEPDHVDPAPAGVDVRDHLSTTELLSRWEARREAKLERLLRGAVSARRFGSAALEQQAADGPDVAANVVPPGTSALPGLEKHVARSCAGTGTDGRRVHALYVVEADDADRYSAVLPMLQDELANVDDTFALSAAETGGMRRVRWVFSSTTTCEPIITKVIVPAGSLVDFSASVQALRAMGYTSTQRKYLVFADTAVLCGVGHIYSDDSASGNANDGNASAMFSRVDTGCWQTTASRGSTAAHELMHNIGGVQASAAHSTPFRHCSDRYDLMCYNDGSGVPMTDVCPSSRGHLFDCRHDDYFTTAPVAGSYLATYWNSANSSFLDRSAIEAGTSAPPPATTPVPAPGDPAPPSVAVSVSGPSSLAPGLPARLVATANGDGAFSWSVSNPDCVAGGTTAATLNLRCSAEQADGVTATVTFVRSDGATAQAIHPVALPSARATLSQSLSAASKSVVKGQSIKVTARLRTGSAAVRGRVRIAASRDGKSWVWASGRTDTGADGAVTFVLRPATTTYLRLSMPGAAGSAWSLSANPVVRVSVGKAATSMTIAKTRTTALSISGRLVITGTSTGVAKRAVVLQYRPSKTGPWRTLRTVTSSITGRVSAKVRPADGTFYRWQYGGSRTHLPVRSAPAYVR